VGDFIDPSDVQRFASDLTEPVAEAMIEDAEAMAVLVAPCLADLGEDDPKRGAVKAILRAAILRWHEAGAGSVQTEVAGPFSKTVQYQGRRSMFQPAEIQQLQGLCASAGAGKAFAVDTAPAVGFAGHALVCSLHFGAAYCSCGADISGGRGPLYGGGV